MLAVDIDIQEATQAQMEAATAGSVHASPRRVQYHPGVAKAWVNFNGTGTVAINASYNVTSITDNGVGDYTVNFTTAFSSANYSMAGAHDSDNYANSVDARATGVVAQSPGTTSCKLRTYNISGSANQQQATDYSLVSAMFFGDQ